MESDIIYWVWLSQVLGIGAPDLEFILSKFGLPKDIYNFGHKNGFSKIKFFNSNIFSKMKRTSLDEAKKIVERCQKNKYEIISFCDKKYPLRLKNIYSSPIVLYVDGNIENIDDTLSIAIIGARKCSTYAEEVAKLFAKNLALQGVNIISGMAMGVDGIALEEAIKNDGRCIAVLGCGLDINYPVKNFKIKSLIKSSKNGCIISEYPPGTMPLAQHFPVRNRIMSGLSLGVLVVEAGEKSGALITAKLAIDQGKDVFGIPNNIFAKNNYGTMNLLKEGAIIVTEPKDIINQYRWQYKLNSYFIETNISDNSYMFENKVDNNLEEIERSFQNLNVEKIREEKHIKLEELNESQKKIYNLLLGNKYANIDYLAEQLDIPVNQILINITEMELNGYIKSYPGMKYGLN